MLQPLLDFAHKIGLRHFVVLVLLLVCLMGLYESATRHFHLTQLERVGRILNVIDPQNADTNTVATRSIITAELKAFSVSTTTPKPFPLKFLLGLTVWGLALSPLAIFVASLKMTRKKVELLLIVTLVYMGTIGLVATIAASFLPVFAWPLSHLLFYPVMFFVGGVVIFMVVGYLQFRDAAKTNPPQ